MSGNRNSGRRPSGKEPACCYCGGPRPIYRNTCNKCNYELSKASRERRKAARLARAVVTRWADRRGYDVPVSADLMTLPSHSAQSVAASARRCAPGAIRSCG